MSEWLHLNGSVPQGSGPFLYVVMMNDMSADGFMCHKCMDDSILTEACDDRLQTTMQDAEDQVTDWSKKNHTKLNGTKTKEMVLTFAKDPPHIPLINMNGTEVERVKSTKLLGVIISDNLK